ncbi:MAG TPA: glycosyltransferase [Bacilli bacterium]|nr:glycosyltransferase [Bacilli bacterium]
MFDVIHIIPSLDFGGAEIMTGTLCSELMLNNVKVCIISLYNKKTTISRQLENKNLHVVYLNKKRGIDINIIFELRKIITKLRPNVINTHLYTLPYVYFSLWFLPHIKIFHTIHSVANKEMNKLYRLFYKILFRVRYAIPIAISPEIKKSIITEYGLIDDQVPTIFNGINMSLFVPKVIYENEDKLVLINVARFNYVKNHRLLLNVFAKLINKYPNLELRLCGEGPLMNEVIELAHALDITNKVNFMGNILNVKEVLVSSDIFVLPSLWEGIPLSLIEAMASGLPVVVNKVGGMVDMINDGIDGVFFHNTDQDLYDKLESLIISKNRRKSLGIEAVKKAQIFNSKKMCQEYIKLYFSSENK